MSTAMQNQRTVAAYLQSKQLLLFDFVGHSTRVMEYWAEKRWRKNRAE